MVGTAIFDGVSLGMIVPLSDRVLTNKEIVIPRDDLPQFIVNFVHLLNTADPKLILKWMAFVLISVFSLKGFCLFVQNLIMNVIGQRCVRDVRNLIYRKFHELSLDFYTKKRTGELVSRITNDVGSITNALSYGLTDLLYQSLRICVLLSIAFYISWKLTLMSFILFPVIVFMVARIGKTIKKYTSETQKKMADLNSHLTETLQGAYIVKVFCRENYENKRFANINQHYYKYVLKMIKRTLMLSPLTEFFGTVSAVLILLVAGNDVIAGKLSFGIFALYLGALLSLMAPFKKITNVHSMNQQALASAKRIYNILDEVPSIREVPNPCEINDFEKEIAFKNISFSYEEADGLVLKDINLNVKKNEIIALVGSSGAGKSTLVSLIPRLYDPQAGMITIDGHDLTNLTLSSLRGLISVVSQEMVIFNSSIFDNIAYGREGASKDDVFEAAKKAFAYDFINKLPKGFDTVVGDRGLRLSGGEKQRLAIARAFLKDSPVLILDEATSHLDAQSEKLVQEALYNLIKGKTVFVIAHRLATVLHATKIVVMDEGGIAEIGTNSELLKSSEIYKKLHKLQFNT